MKTIKAINDEAVAYALRQVVANSAYTMGNFDTYHSDYLWETGLPIGTMDKVVDVYGENYHTYKAQIEHLKAQKQ